jgi:putative addiction module killer protein
MSEIELRVYKTESGKKPFAEWRQSLSVSSRQIVDAQITKLRNPNFTNYKRVGEVFELRVFLDGGYRIYFGKEGTEIIILLVAGDKDTQVRDIRKAEELWARYKNETR